MSERKDRERAGAPQPEQVVAAATTQTGPNQENARTLRTTDGLRAGEPPAGGEGPAEESCAEALAEEQWFAHGDDARPPHAEIVSKARAIEEALARLGPDASPADVQRDLERAGVEVSLDQVCQVQGSCHPAAIPPAAAPVDPTDLVRTESERVPPPDRPRP